jgi:hypothetical protein
MLNEVDQPMVDDMVQMGIVGGRGGGASGASGASAGCIFVGENGSTSSGRGMQCAIAWNPQTFSLVQTEEMEKMRCVMALLRHNVTGVTTWFAAVHLSAGERPTSEDR